MRVFISFIFFASIVKICYSQVYDSTIIFWDDGKLTWDSFKGIPNPNYGATAISETGLFYHVFDNDYVAIFVLFRTSGSYTHEHNEEALEHEQIHFDICELYARKMNKAFHERQNDENFTKEKCQKLLDSIYIEYNNYQEKYDKGCYFGADTLKQKEWEMRVDSEIDELDKYKIDYEALERELIESDLPLPQVQFSDPLHFVIEHDEK